MHIESGRLPAGLRRMAIVTSIAQSQIDVIGIGGIVIIGLMAAFAFGRRIVIIPVMTFCTIIFNINMSTC